MKIDAKETPNKLAEFQAKALEIALSHIGHGEDPSRGNNRGEWVDFFRAHDGLLPSNLHQARTGGSGDWCATFTSACDNLAAEALGIVLPHETSRGSKALVRNVLRAGGHYCARGNGIAKAWLVTPDISSGAWIAWDRGQIVNGKTDWSGHSERVVSYDPTSDTLITIGGNKRNRSTVVKGKTVRYAVVDRFTYPNGTWKRRCEAIVSYV